MFENERDSLRFGRIFIYLFIYLLSSNGFEQKRKVKIQVYTPWKKVDALKVQST